MPFFGRALLAAAAAVILSAAALCARPSAFFAESAWAKSAPQADRRQLTREQSSLQGQISNVKKDISAKEARLTSVNAELRKSEQAISLSSRTLKTLAEEKEKIEAQLVDLNNDYRRVTRSTKEAEKDLEQISKAQFLNAQRHPWQSLLSGSNPNEIQRMSGILKYLNDERDKTVYELTNRQKLIAENTRKTTAKRAELARVQAAEQKNREQLREEQKSRETARASLTKELNSQRERYEQLVKNDQELSKLIADIDVQIAEAQKKEAARQLALQKKAEEERRRKKAAARSDVKSEPAVVASPAINFAQLKGRLTMPASGTIAARFGQKREGAASTLPWRGLLIRAKQGASVVAAAPGTVVFSDWMRGFGNLLIVDHGSNYLSVYANNESLFKSVGDRVKQGETIASVGNSGGEERPGLYFEIRRRGTPIDPSPWLAKR